MLGKKLKELRVERGLTLSDVAKEIGVSIASLSKYEHGIHIPGDFPLSQLAKFYGVTTDELLMESADDEVTETDTYNKMCPWRVKQGVDKWTGNTMTWFMPCLGKQCMAYDEGVCAMLSKGKRGVE